MECHWQKLQRHPQTIGNVWNVIGRTFGVADPHPKVPAKLPELISLLMESFLQVPKLLELRKQRKWVPQLLDAVPLQQAESAILLFALS